MTLISSHQQHAHNAEAQVESLIQTTKTQLLPVLDVQVAETSRGSLMEIVPILSTIILVGTMATFILAVAAYVLAKMREK